MNAIFEPSLLFIADEDWWDDEKRDAFLEHLLDHLEMLDEYDICQVCWTNELDTILFSNPHMHPWHQSDLRIPLIPNIHKKFYSRTEYCLELDSPCLADPILKENYSNSEASEATLKIIHAQIELEEDFYFCVGLANQLPSGQSYTFSCDCHTFLLSPKVLNNAADWLSELDPVELFFPTSMEDFDLNFEKALKLVRDQNFPRKQYLYEFKFTKNFKKSIIQRTTLQLEILEAVVKKLIFTTDESRLDLKDEYIDKKKEWRFRVTPRPHSTRIQYTVEGKTINFLQYYGEGEHDDGL